MPYKLTNKTRIVNNLIILSAIFSFYPALMAQQQVNNPHGNKLNISCGTCHTTADWNNVTAEKFDHDHTGFALFGAHNKIQCVECHQSLILNRVGIACIDCHTDIHAGELGNQCENCHNSMSWENRSEAYENHNQTNFPLVGVHANLDCASCHFNEQQKQFALLSVECKSCHLQDYMTTLSPSHQKAAFDLNCQKCHLQVVSQWENAVFQHPQTFPLVGAHKMAECIDCHSAGYNGTSMECYTCHRSDYENAVNPDHLKFGFPTVCQECHNGINWERSVFDHLTESGFAIEGAHLSILCVDCHQNNQLTGIPRNCIGCHQDDYNSASDPNHIQNDFSFECQDCHGLNTWQPAVFDHLLTQFPLTGAHINVDCADCHTMGYIQPLNTDCFSCHEQNFNSVTDPNHISNNFDHDCMQCHNNNDWTPAVFDHLLTQFPLTGAHISVDCSGCHSSGYDNTPLICVVCHQTDYDDTMEPNHAIVQFPNICEDCHNTIDWTPADWDHDTQYFPINSGKHREEWNSCSDCHVYPTNYVQVECINCHEHSQKDMDDKHHEEQGYEYLTIKCLECHYDGRVH